MKEFLVKITKIVYIAYSVKHSFSFRYSGIDWFSSAAFVDNTVVSLRNIFVCYEDANRRKISNYNTSKIRT